MCMGIAGSTIDQDFFQEYLGMRYETIDEVEILRRIDSGSSTTRGIRDGPQMGKRIVRKDSIRIRRTRSLQREEKDEQWEFVVKCYIIFRDIMVGNPKLAEMGFVEESCGTMPLPRASRDSANGRTI